MTGTSLGNTKLFNTGRVFEKVIELRREYGVSTHEKPEISQITETVRMTITDDLSHLGINRDTVKRIVFEFSPAAYLAYHTRFEAQLTAFNDQLNAELSARQMANPFR